jgi:rubrerythrin
MKVSVKDKKVADAQTPVANPQKTEREAVCEICGQKLERDPESWEYICPVCDYEEDLQ